MLLTFLNLLILQTTNSLMEFFNKIFFIIIELNDIRD